MAHIITALCLRDGACVDVCPVECIIKGMPEAEWPWFFIDPNTCIDCGACVPECPYEAIFPESEIPEAYTMKAGQILQPFGADRITAEGGEVVNLVDAIAIPGSEFSEVTATAINAAFYAEGPGYGAKSMEGY